MLKYRILNLIEVLVDLIVTDEAQLDLLLLSVSLLSVFCVDHSGQVFDLTIHSAFVDRAQLF